MIRFFDIIFSLIGIFILWPLWMVLYVLCYFDTRSPVLVQERLGKDLKPFKLYKFRTMHVDTLPMASHLADHNSITRFGVFLRKSKLDEFPQLINVLKGEMSLVGPRPVILSEVEVIEARKLKGVYAHLPGITGLSQINKIDTSNPIRLARVDAQMQREFNLFNYFAFIISTVTGKGQGDCIKELNINIEKPEPRPEMKNRRHIEFKEQVG